MDASVAKRLEAIVGEGNLQAGEADRALHCYDASFPESLPDAVAYPETAEVVSGLLAFASAEGIPVVPRGAGTGLSGGSVPAEGGIALCLSKMNRIRDIDAENLIAYVEPGVVNAHLQAAVAKHGLFYPPDPASMKVCTLGGNVASDAGGPKCFKYGVTKNYVLGLNAVLADGEEISTGGCVVKNTTGYDLTRLFVGSEGTLGVISDITLRLMPIPEGKRTMLALYDSLDAASRSVSAIVSAGIVPSALEMMDNLLIRCAEDYVHAGLPTDAAALLLLEVDGAEGGLQSEVETIERVCREVGVREFRVAASAEETDTLWLARRTIIGAAGRFRPSVVLQDVTVPRTKLPEMVAKTVEIGKKHDTHIGVLAHAGDGNLHPLFLFDGRNPEELEREQAAEKEIFEAALELRGTLTGEHGVGLTKREYLSWQLKPREIASNRGVKTLFDPKNIMNPGKIFA